MDRAQIIRAEFDALFQKMQKAAQAKQSPTAISAPRQSLISPSPIPHIVHNSTARITSSILGKTTISASPEPRKRPLSDTQIAPAVRVSQPPAQQPLEIEVPSPKRSAPAKSVKPAALKQAAHPTAKSAASIRSHPIFIRKSEAIVWRPLRRPKNFLSMQFYNSIATRVLLTQVGRAHADLERLWNLRLQAHWTNSPRSIIRSMHACKVFLIRNMRRVVPEDEKVKLTRQAISRGLTKRVRT